MKDYYKILGINKQASQQDIKNAYRRLARKLHPDMEPGKTSEDFLNIKEAFDVLSDIEKRDAYNQRCGFRQGRAGTAPESGFYAEEIRREPDSGDFPGFRFWREKYADPFLPAESYLARDEVEVFLSDEEAQSGGIICLDVPVYRRCRACGGTGSGVLWYCRNCDGEGVEYFTRPVKIRIPPLAGKESRIEIDLLPADIQGRLQVTFKAGYR